MSETGLPLQRPAKKGMTVHISRSNNRHPVSEPSLARNADSENANSCQLEIKMELEICLTGRIYPVLYTYECVSGC